MKRSLTFAALALCAVVSAQAQVRVDAPWVRTTVPEQKSTGAFMAITDPKLPDRRLFLPYKNSLGKLPSGLGYFIESAFVGEDRHILSSRIVWDSAPVTMTANEALAATVENQKSKAKNEAGEFLRTNMADPGEPYSAAELIEMGAKKGINKRTLQRAADKMGVRKSRKEFKGKVWWNLPEDFK